MPRIGLLLGQLPQARTTRLLSSLLHRYASDGTELIEVDYTGLPHHAPYTDVPLPASAARLKRDLAGVDGLLVVTPTHERSLPGALKGAIDWAACSPNVLAGMPTVIAGAAAPGTGYFAALTHLRTVLGDAGAELKAQPEHTLEVAAEHFDDAGLCVSVDLGAAALDLLAAAAGYVAHLTRIRGGAVPTDPVAVVADLEATAPLSPIAGVPRVADLSRDGGDPPASP